MSVCADLGVATEQVEGRSGVWVRADERGPDRKVAAIGVRVARGVTMHGFALNCDPDMSAFANMIPCGIADAGATSLSAELGRDVPVAEVVDAVEAALRAVLTPVPTA
jgi:lipoyl(octanoyl) transferase